MLWVEFLFSFFLIAGKIRILFSRFSLRLKTGSDLGNTHIARVLRHSTF